MQVTTQGGKAKVKMLNQISVIFSTDGNYPSHAGVQTVFKFDRVEGKSIIANESKKCFTGSLF